MSRDLLLKTTPKNWARGGQSSPVTAPPIPKLIPTDGERARVEKLAALRSRAASGDKRAKREWKKALAKVASLRTRAHGGDPKAARACQVLRQSGVLGKSAVSGYAEHKTYLADASVEAGKTGTLVLEPVVALTNSTLTLSSEQGLGNFQVVKVTQGGKTLFDGKPTAIKEGGVISFKGVVSKDSPVKIVVRYTGSGRGTLKAQLDASTSSSGREKILGDADSDRLAMCMARHPSDPGSCLGEFVDDEERLSRESGSSERAASARISGAFPNFNRGRDRGRRARRLRKLAWRSSRGDASATSRLQQVTARLQQRASSGDTRAAALLQQLQAAQARAQAAAAAQPVVAQPVAAAATTPTYVPPPVPAPVANVTYSAPYSSDEDYDE